MIARPSEREKKNGVKIIREDQFLREVLIPSLLIFAVVTFFSLNLVPGKDSNAVDVLTQARQFADPNWLPHDWYLNLDVPHRELFNRIFGPLISKLGLISSALILNCLFFLMIAFALNDVFRLFRIRLPLRICGVMLFLVDQSVAAGEWIIMEPEAKVLAYFFALLSFSAFFRRRYGLGWGAAGAALSFHVLVGSYALFCLAAAVICTPGRIRNDMKKILCRCWIFILTGAFGIKIILSEFLSAASLDNGAAWDIYVRFRNPHHLLPSAWSGPWIAWLTGALVVLVIVYWKGRSREARFAAAFGLSSLLLFGIGILIFSLGNITWLRFYWFRFPDTMIPLIGAVLVVWAINDLSYGNLPIPLPKLRFLPWIRKTLRHFLPPVLLLVSVSGGFLVSRRFYLRYTAFRQGSIARLSAENREGLLPLLHWIRRYTPRDAVFLVDPAISDFSFHAERAVYVLFKQVPSRGRDILEWYSRLKEVNRNRDPTGTGFDALSELSDGFHRLSEDALRDLSGEGSVQFYLSQTRQDLPWDAVHQSGSFSLYRLNNKSRQREKKLHGEGF